MSAAQADASDDRNWKAKFSEKQLERKRLVDRVGQKRIRQHMKRNISQLEEKVELLVRGEQNTLLRNLIDENGVLRMMLDRYESKMEGILLSAKDCLDISLEETQASSNAPRGARANPEQSRSPSRASILGSSPTFDSGDAMCERFVSDRSLPFMSPVMFHGGAILGQSAASLLQVCPEEVVEYITTWKLLNNHGLGFGFLINSLALNKPPLSLTTELIRERVSSNKFYKNLLEQLVAPMQPHPPQVEEEEGVLEILPEMEIQRRAIALCVCDIVSRWRLLFRSPLECLSMFWATYKFFVFLTFPSCENLLKSPTWIWPTKLQLAEGHPGFIDCLIWPHLREKLITTWHNYNVKALSIQLVRNLELSITDHNSFGIPLSINADNSGLCIDAGFEKKMFDLGNWGLSSSFFSQFPDLRSSFDDLNPDSPSIFEGRILPLQVGQQPTLISRLPPNVISGSSTAAYPNSSPLTHPRALSDKDGASNRFVDLDGADISISPCADNDNAESSLKLTDQIFRYCEPFNFSQSDFEHSSLFNSEYQPLPGGCNINYFPLTSSKNAFGYDPTATAA